MDTSPYWDLGFTWHHYIHQSLILHPVHVISCITRILIVPVFNSFVLNVFQLYFFFLIVTSHCKPLQTMYSSFVGKLTREVLLVWDHGRVTLLASLLLRDVWFLWGCIRVARGCVSLLALGCGPNWCDLHGCRRNLWVYRLLLESED